MKIPRKLDSLITARLEWIGLTRAEFKELVQAGCTFLVLIALIGMYLIPDVIRTYETLVARHRAAGDLRAERASTGEVLHALKLEPDFEKDLHIWKLGKGSVLDVWYGSHLTIGIPSFDRAGLHAALDGYADITVESPLEVMDVRTWAGRAWLAPGKYSIICDPGCKRMLVYVEKGVASISGDSSGTELALHDGESGAVPRGGRSEKIDSATFQRYYLDEWGMKP